jgi:oligoendopeptidase F
MRTKSSHETAPGTVLTKGPKAGDLAKKDLGHLPEWNLADLYSGPEAPELKADLATSDRAATAMQESYQGKLATLADGGKGGQALVQAVREFEALNDLLGRVISYASLL